MMLKFHIQLVILLFFFKRESFLNDSAIIDWLFNLFFIINFNVQSREKGQW